MRNKLQELRDVTLNEINSRIRVLEISAGAGQPSDWTEYRELVGEIKALKHVQKVVQVQWEKVSKAPLFGDK